jgi:hypothetical protein
MPDEQLAGQHRVDPPVLHAAARDDRQAVQGHLLESQHRALPAVPVRLAVTALDQVRRQLLGPLRLDPGIDPAPQPAGLDQFRRHHPARLLLEQRRAREDRELRAPRAEILALVGVLQPDV